MKKGPIFNDNTRNFTTRDSLGIESVAASISGELCPIVTTVTPRAFYWAFLVWIYYDFYKYSGIEEHNLDTLNKYVKRQDYFFVLSQLLVESDDQVSLVGKQNTELDALNNETGWYSYNPKYFKARFGGMQYYNGGCVSLDYIRELDVETGKYFSLPKITKAGEQLALSFMNIIKNTEYYKCYRLNDISVPESVLKEYGKVLNLSLKGFDECKDNLKKKMFIDITPNNKYLNDSKEYVNFIFKERDMTEVSLSKYRKVLFDVYSCRGENKTFPDGLRYVVNGWEMVIGRQYFTSGLEAIWKYMLEQIYNPKTKDEWISYSINNSEWSVDVKTVKLQDMLDEANYSFEEREDMIRNATHYYNPEKMVENGFKLLLSMYNRFIDRSDYGEESQYLSWGIESNSISFSELFEKVNEYRNLPIKDFVVFVMDEWLIKQHYITALEKMIQKRDGFFYEEVDGYYSHKNSFTMFFQGIRLFQLSQVMKDLELL